MITSNSILLPHSILKPNMNSILLNLAIFIVIIAHALGQNNAGDNVCLVQSLDLNKKVDDLCIFDKPFDVPQGDNEVADPFGIYTRRKWATLSSLEHQVNGDPDDTTDENNAAIVGGDGAEPNTRKNLVLILVRTENSEETYVCTGTILKKTKRLGLILTSASCFYDLKTKRLISESVFVKPGIQNRIKDLSGSANFYLVESILIRNKFAKTIETMENDAAILVIKRDSTKAFSELPFHAIQLPTVRNTLKIYQKGFQKKIGSVQCAGWGVVKKSGEGRFARRLQQVDLVVRRKKNCITCYPPDVTKRLEPLEKEELICARGEKEPNVPGCENFLPQTERKGLCFGGDFGAPLFIDRKFDPVEKSFSTEPATTIFQIGIASFHDWRCGFNSWFTSLMDEDMNKDIRNIMNPIRLFRGKTAGWQVKPLIS